MAPHTTKTIYNMIEQQNLKNKCLCFPIISLQTIPRLSYHIQSPTREVCSQIPKHLPYDLFFAHLPLPTLMILKAVTTPLITVPQSLPGNPPLPTRQTPAPVRRQAACKHTALTRLYDTYGCYPCQMCRKRPNIGWVYGCTQDSNGFLPESDFTTREETAPTIIISKGKAVWRLKQWMYEAVLKGQYTVEQFSTLFQQRLGVKKAIFSHSNRTAIPSSLVPPDSSNNSPGTVSITLSFIASSYLDEGCELSTDEDEYFHSRKHCPDKAHQQLLGGRDVATTIERNTPSGPSYRACTWMCCQRCRPHYRDRAWLSLDAVVNETTKAPPSWEMENRRISDVRVVAKIGLPKPGLLFQIDDSRYDSSSEAPRSSDSNLVESKTDRCAYGSIFDGHQKEGLRVAVGRLLNRVTSHTRASSSESRTSSKNSSQSSPR